LLHLGLAVDHHVAADQPLEVDPDPPSRERELDALVDVALDGEALAESEPREHLGAALLEHAGPDAPENVGAAAALEHDVLDAGAVQEVGEQGARRPSADDRDLGAHRSPPSKAS